MIALAAGLLARDAAYQRDGHVYFRGAATARRAGLDRPVALRLAAEYGDHPDDAGKDDPFDVAVWQASYGDQPAWESPWGPGRPGWHAECAAMALHTFGPAVDVHAGGGDLRFPHHAYQAALAEAFTGVTPFARARLQAGVVRVAGAKMAKSAGNLVLVSDLLRDYPAGAVRLLILDRQWDQDWDYNQASLDEAAAGWSGCRPRPDAPTAPRRDLVRRWPPSGPHWPATSTCPPRSVSPKTTAARPPASSAPSWDCGKRRGQRTEASRSPAPADHHPQPRARPARVYPGGYTLAAGPGQRRRAGCAAGEFTAE